MPQTQPLLSSAATISYADHLETSNKIDHLSETVVSRDGKIAWLQPGWRGIRMQVIAGITSRMVLSCRAQQRSIGRVAGLILSRIIDGFGQQRWRLLRLILLSIPAATPVGRFFWMAYCLDRPAILNGSRTLSQRAWANFPNSRRANFERMSARVGPHKHDRSKSTHITR